jgi:aspartate kinase
MTQNIIVSKFGGSSMASFETMSRSAKIAIRQKSNIIVVSAVFGITNDLISLFEMTKKSNQNSLEKILYSIKEKHLDIIYSLSDHKLVLEKFNTEFNKLDQIAKGLLLLKEFNLSVYDQILSFGERISSLIFSEVLTEIGNVKVNHIDSRDYIITDDFFSQASPITHLIKERAKNLKLDSPIVAGGFIGSTKDGKTTTIGRGGSDYTAALLAEAINASALEIWTDVDGIATCDPRLVEGSKRIADISYKEASELAFYGAKILHPITIQPVKRSGIPIFVGSSLIDASNGTWIKECPTNLPKLRAIAVRSDQILLKIQNKNLMRTPKLLEKVIETFEIFKAPIDTLQISETTLTILIPKELSSIKKHLDAFTDTNLKDNLSLISFVGNQITHKDSLKSEILSLLGDINLWSINLGASENSFTIAVDKEEAQTLVQKIHYKYL